MLLLSLVAALGSFAVGPEKIKEIFDTTVAASQQIATAGDLRSMSNMLDYEYLRKGRYPREERFNDWLSATFKEDNLKDMETDHWGNPYIYRTDKTFRHYTLTSPGPDGIAGTRDDLRISGP